MSYLLIIEQLSPTEFDLKVNGLDAHLRWEPKTNDWTLDVFNSHIARDHNRAHVGTYTCGENPAVPDWSEAITTLTEHNGQRDLGAT